jgi:hypothetical protein
MKTLTGIPVQSKRASVLIQKRQSNSNPNLCDYWMTLVSHGENDFVHIHETRRGTFWPQKAAHVYAFDYADLQQRARDLNTK